LNSNHPAQKDIGEIIDKSKKPGALILFVKNLKIDYANSGRLPGRTGHGGAP